MGCKKLTYQNFSFLEVIHPKKRVSAEKKRIKDYVGNYVYENGTLQFFNQPEGYVEPNGGAGYNYVYQYKDHLGNIRLSYSDKNNNGIILVSTDPNTTEIVEENNYYPFGLKHKGYNNVQNGRNHKYGFGGKEEQDELGLGWIDITARNYDPALGRWMNLDPLAEQMRRHSPYNFAFNNPIFFIDPDGMAPLGYDNDWEPLGGGRYKAEAGDSAVTLARDAKTTNEKANSTIENQLGKNYKGADNEMKSDVEIGDVVLMSDEYVASMKQKTIVKEANENLNVVKEVFNEETKGNIHKLDSANDVIQSKEVTIEAYTESHPSIISDGPFGKSWALGMSAEKSSLQSQNKKTKEYMDSLTEVNKTYNNILKRLNKGKPIFKPVYNITIDTFKN